MADPRPFSTPVDPSWLDYNGHVNDAAYAAIVGLANEELFVDVNLSAGYREETGRALYSAKLTINYLNEIPPDATIRVLRTITRLGGKSLTVGADFQVDGRSVATTEHIYVLVDSNAGASVPLNESERARVEHLVGQQH